MSAPNVSDKLSNVECVRTMGVQKEKKKKKDFQVGCSPRNTRRDCMVLEHLGGSTYLKWKAPPPPPDGLCLHLPKRRHPHFPCNLYSHLLQRQHATLTPAAELGFPEVFQLQEWEAPRPAQGERGELMPDSGRWLFSLSS